MFYGTPLMAAFLRLLSSLKSFAFYKFTNAKCKSCYEDETKHNLPTKINKDFVASKNLLLFQQSSENFSDVLHFKNYC